MEMKSNEISQVPFSSFISLLATSCKETQQGLFQPLLSSPWRTKAEHTYVQAVSFSPHLHSTSWPKLVKKCKEIIHEVH